MLTETALSRTGYADLPFGSSYEAFGCAVNRISIEDLFSRYEQCGFLYPAKLQRFKPYWRIITENWRKSIRTRAGRLLHDVVVYQNPSTDAWAAVTGWATTNRSSHWQHLVSIGQPEASRAVLLSSQSQMDTIECVACQNWFRAENRYPARIFGSCTLSLGPQLAAVSRHALVSVPRDRLVLSCGDIQVHPCTDADSATIDRLARRLCGSVQAAADEWAHGDINLSQLDDRYRSAGLRRYRRVFVATAPGALEPVGLAVAYRGPLGLNFSFLESRCELWIDPRLDDGRLRAAASVLLHAAAAVYEDFELPSIPVTSDEFIGRCLIEQGAEPLQNYSRSVWLRDGYPAWYAHVNGFYSRVIAAAQRKAGHGDVR